MRIVVIEDHDATAHVLRRVLEAHHHAVDLAPDGRTGIELVRRNEYDLILLDVMLPDIDGFTTVRRIRDEGFTTPVLMLTAMSSTENIIAGLEHGADDYLTKPFDIDVLLARVRSLLRRDAPIRSGSFTIGSLDVDLAGRRVLRDGEERVLTAKEFALLEYLALRNGEFVTREEILEHVWGGSDGTRSNVVASLVRFLRAKIDAPDGDSLIESRRRVGYRLRM